MCIPDVRNGWRHCHAVEHQSLTLGLSLKSECHTNATFTYFYAITFSTHDLYPVIEMKTPPSGDRRYSRPANHFPSSIFLRMAFSDSPVIWEARWMVT